MTLYELALHFKEMRDMQTAYFASKKANRWGDKKLLAASKAKEAELDELVRGIVEAGVVVPPLGKEIARHLEKWGYNYWYYRKQKKFVVSQDHEQALLMLMEEFGSIEPYTIEGPQTPMPVEEFREFMNTILDPELFGPEQPVQGGTPCSGDCGMNYCDENGCMDRKRVLTDPASMPEKGGAGV